MIGIAVLLNGVPLLACVCACVNDRMVCSPAQGFLRAMACSSEHIFITQNKDIARKVRATAQGSLLLLLLAAACCW